MLKILFYIMGLGGLQINHVLVSVVLSPQGTNMSLDMVLPRCTEDRYCRGLYRMTILVSW